MAAARTAQQSEEDYQEISKEQPPEPLLRNGMEAGSVRGVIYNDVAVNSKTKFAGHSNSSEMSQYEQGVDASVQNTGEKQGTDVAVDSTKSSSDSKSFRQSSEHSGPGEPIYNKVSETGQNMHIYSLGFSGRGTYHPSDHHGRNVPMQGNAENVGLNVHPFNHFGSRNKHNFHGSKPMPSSQMISLRPTNGASTVNSSNCGLPSHGPKVLTGENMPPQTGPTPTLNQLLQSSHSVFQCQNNYNEYGLQKSGEQGSTGALRHQSWPPHRPLSPYSLQQGGCRTQTLLGPPYGQPHMPAHAGGGSGLDQRSWGHHPLGPSLAMPYAAHQQGRSSPPGASHIPQSYPPTSSQSAHVGQGPPSSQHLPPPASQPSTSQPAQQPQHAQPTQQAQTAQASQTSQPPQPQPSPQPPQPPSQPPQSHQTQTGPPHSPSLQPRSSPQPPPSQHSQSRLQPSPHNPLPPQSPSGVGHSGQPTQSSQRGHASQQQPTPQQQQQLHQQHQQQQQQQQPTPSQHPPQPPHQPPHQPQHQTQHQAQHQAQHQTQHQSQHQSQHPQHPLQHPPQHQQQHQAQQQQQLQQQQLQQQQQQLQQQQQQLQQQQQQQQQLQQQQHQQQLDQQSPQAPFPLRSPQSSAPNTHAPEAPDLNGQNSNDSSSGPGAPGTPNSQGMRPTPSPTGSTGSRSMSPAVGQQNIPMPPRPSSGQSDGSGPARMSHSPMATPGGYQQPLGPPPHMHGPYKLPSHPPGIVPPGGQQMGPYTPNQQYSQGSYSARPQGQLANMQYGPSPGYGQQSPQGNSLNAGQYPNRPMPNHVPHSQFGGYQGWGNPGVNQGPPANAVGNTGSQMPPKGPGQGPGAGPGGGPPAGGQSPNVATQGTNSSSSGPRSLTPPHYLKQHLQQKMQYGSSGTNMPPSPGSLQVGYGGSPSVGSNAGSPVGPSPHLGPGMGSGGAMHHHGPPSMNSPMGPPSGHLHPGMGPPAPNMGPPGPGGMGSGTTGMGPPSSSGASSVTNNAGPMPVSSAGSVLQGPPGPPGPPNAASPIANSHHHDGPMPPPTSSSGSSLPHPPTMPGVPHSEMNSVSDSSHDNGVTTTTTVAGTTTTNVTPATPGTVTSVVTTGPDGTPLDEGSQQSTLSNASQASGEDQTCTPKRKDGSVVGGSGGYHSHPPTPQSTVPSPGAASLNSMHEEYGDVNSPSWPRTPASPVSSKPDSLCKLYEMDDSHERRMWLDKLLQYMEERGTPISACPTISKNPLDLFRLYLFVKERGGFMEVTKNKTWKDIAGLLGIGASSSAAYTLRKHYMKNLLAYECHFDRGGIDPQSIINQVEASSKKKSVKAVSVPSPGSSNSQDSFPAAGSSGTSMDGFGYGYPPGSTPDYNSAPMQRPATQTNAPSPHAGVGVPTQGAGDNISVSNPFDDVGPPGQPPQRLGLPNSYGPSYGTAGGSPRTQGMQQGYQGQGGYSQYPQDQYGRGPPSSHGQDFNQQYSPSGSYPANRGMYPPYGSDADRNYNQAGSGSQPSGMQQGSSQDPYRFMGPGQPPVYPARSGYGGPPPPTAPAGQQPPAGYPGQQDYYRPDQVYSGGQPPPAGGPGGQMYPSGPKSMPPPQQPRRHPDFAKEQPPAPYPQYGQQRPAVYGWGGNSNQYRNQFSPQCPVPQAPQQWGQAPPRPTGPPSSQSAASQWDQHRYTSSGQPPYPQSQQSQQQWGPSMGTPGVGQSSPLRSPMGPRGPYRPEGKPFSVPTPPGAKGQPGAIPVSSPYPAQSTPKREITFPPDSVEATVPVLYKRKRMTRTDVSPVEAWRLMMSLRSGLLAEACWALDVLNILLFDDTTVAYFGLAHMPGLLDILLEHFRRSLADMFDAPISTPALPCNCEEGSDGKWYQRTKEEPSEVDLGSVTAPVDPEERVCILQTAVNYSLITRKGETVKVVNKDSDIFVLDSRKVWDVDGDVTEENVTAELEQDPWQLATSDSSSTKYIVTCFQGEFGNVPFVRVLPAKKKDKEKEEEENTPTEKEPSCEPEVLPEQEQPITASNVKPEPDLEIMDSASEKSSDTSKEENTSNQECALTGSDRKNCDKKKRTHKSLSEVLSRIKKEPVEINNILAEIRDKVEKNEVSEVTKKDENSGDEASNTGSSEKASMDIKTEEPVEASINSISLENGTSSNNSSDSDKNQEEGEDSKTEESGMEENQISKGEDEEKEVEEKKEEASEEAEEKKPTLNIRDPAGTLKRRRMSDYEDECYTRDEASLYLVTDTQDSLARRCVCLSNILRNLTFVPGNEVEFAKNPTFLGLLGKLLLLHHEHPARTAKQRNYDREEDADFGDSCSSLQGESEWWWDFLHHIRENALVTAANIAGHMDLGQYPEEISRPVLDGLLHWAVCPAAHGQDPFPTVSSALSPQRLALEALCKLCVTENNVDLVIATPPYSRLERLCAVLTKLLCRGEEQVLREFAVNLLHYLSAADSGVARTVALQSPCVSLLVAFIEQAEASALGVANQHGIAALRDNPDSMGTSLDMLRRAAGTLLHLARHPENRPLFLQQEQRLLALVMSQILDQQVASIISRVLFQCSRSPVESGDSYTS